MKRHMERVRASLGDLSGLAHQTEQAERNILKAAEKRMTAVQAQIERAAPGIEAAPDASQDRYTALIEERGQLELVIRKAKAALGV